jgi:hypothetical protein
MKTKSTWDEWIVKQIEIDEKENEFKIKNSSKEGWHHKTEISPGIFYSGSWENGKMCGEGRMTFPDGTEVRAIWVNDNPKNVSYIINPKQAKKNKTKEEYLKNFEPSIFKNILMFLYFISIIPLTMLTKDFLDGNDVHDFFVWLILLVEIVFYIWVMVTQINWRLLGSD